MELQFYSCNQRFIFHEKLTESAFTISFEQLKSFVLLDYNYKLTIFV